jgi:cation diffusion facilitator family transporter
MSEAKAPVAGGHSGGLRVVLVALVINLLIALFKFIAAGFSGSTAMLAEAVHSLADTANQAFLLIGMRRSSRPPDALHPFGYGTESYFWAFIVAGSIFLIGAAVSIWEGSEKIWHILHHDQTTPHGNVKWAIIVLSVSLVLESWSLRAAVQEFAHMTAGKGLRKTIEDARDPTVLTVLFEDLAALFGLAVALIGVGASYLTGNPLWDAMASIVVGVALLVVAIFLGRDSMSLLIGEAVPSEEHDRIVALAAAHPGVLEVVHLRTKHIAPQEVLATFKIRFARDLTMDALEQKINDMEAELRAQFPHLRRIYVEPGFDEAKQRREKGIQH